MYQSQRDVIFAEDRCVTKLNKKKDEHVDLLYS